MNEENASLREAEAMLHMIRKKLGFALDSRRRLEEKCEQYRIAIATGEPLYDRRGRPSHPTPQELRELLRQLASRDQSVAGNENRVQSYEALVEELREKA